MYAAPLVRDYRDVAALVGLSDANRLRMAYANQALGTDIPTFTDFDAMLEQTEPETVIVATMDGTHHRFIIRALEAGCDVITEKPLTIDEEKCRAILAAEERTGRTVTVTFNYRYISHHSKIRELVQQGAIGRVLSVDFHWYLDTQHGADYFRRWHRRMSNSGGLLVHKASHHFDLVNWWLDTEPEEVFAWGALRFYGPTREERGERCLTCRYRDTCAFYFDLGSREHLRQLYLQAESEDGYYRDRCVFSEEIDIYDTMTVAVRYANGACMSYSLNAFMPYEGYRLAINGDRGRLEADLLERAPGRSEPPRFELRLAPHFQPAEEIEVALASGEHGGGDRRLRDALFRDTGPDPLARQADSRAGALATLTGAAANRSIQWGRPVTIQELLQPEPPS
ncbi:MAG: hypothetical protein A2148_00285, partial [Chloroflexi bacterium RBG_16_68_14]